MRVVLSLFLTFTLVLSGCASMKVTLGSDESHLALGGVIGGLGGAVLAPKDEKKEVHGGIWAIIGMGLIAIYKVVTNKHKKENQALKDENYILKNRPEFKIIDTYRAKNNKPLFPGGPTSGTWHFKGTDLWIPDGRGRLLHSTQEFIRVDEKSKNKKKNEK